MFEDPLAKKKTGLSKFWIDILVVAGLIVLLVGYRVLTKGPARENVRTMTTAADVSAADPVKDLKIQRATMQKDSMGTTAVWAVSLVNRSEKFTYTGITYQTDYIGADNNLIVENKGTISATIGPNAEGNFEIRDTAYPTGTAWYKFKVTGATAKVE